MENKLQLLLSYSYMLKVYAYDGYVMWLQRLAGHDPEGQDITYPHSLPTDPSCG